MEGIGTGIRSEASGYFLLDFELPDSAFGAVVVGWYCLILKEVEYVIPTSDYPPFHLIELIAHIVKVLFEQLIKPRQPTVFRDYLISFLIPQMDGFPQQCLHIFCPCLFLVYIIEIFEISQQMSQTYLIVEEVNGEVRAVAVCHSDHILQRVTEAFFKDFGATASAPEHESQIRCLRNP